MKSEYISTRIKTGTTGQNRRMNAWYRHQRIIDQLDGMKQEYINNTEQEGK